MRSRTSGSIGGRPGCPLLLYVHFLLMSSRCQRRRVSGLTMNDDHRSLGIARLAAASRTRSRRWSRGRFTCRCSTFTWCRSTRSSISRPSSRRRPVPRTRPTRQYTSENSMELRSGRGEGHATDVAEPRSGKLNPSGTPCFGRSQIGEIRSEMPWRTRLTRSNGVFCRPPDTRPRRTPGSRAPIRSCPRQLAPRSHPEP